MADRKVCETTHAEHHKNVLAVLQLVCSASQTYRTLGTARRYATPRVTRTGPVCEHHKNVLAVLQFVCSASQTYRSLVRALHWIRSLSSVQDHQPIKMDEWVKKQYCETYCDDKGQLVAQTINLDTFCEHLKSRRPEEAKEITRAVKR